MLRNALIGFLIVVIAASASRAATASVSYSSAPTVGLPGYTTYVFTAHSDVRNIGFDFYGDGSMNPGTRLGFFGPMNQLNPFGQATVFSYNNPIIVFAGLDTRHDSQFSSCVDCEAIGKEGPDFLQGKGGTFGNDRPFAQLVVPNARREPIQFRGKIIIYESANVATEFSVSGTIPPIPEPATCVLAALALCAGVRTRRRKPRAYEACGPR